MERIGPLVVRNLPRVENAAFHGVFASRYVIPHEAVLTSDSPGYGPGPIDIGDDLSRWKPLPKGVPARKEPKEAPK